MSSPSAPRFAAIASLSTRKPRAVAGLDSPSKVSEIFGTNTFSTRVMREKLPADVFRRLQQTIAHGDRLDASIAAEVAHAVKEWAIERGATHYCHWFQPQTGASAEKHDAFIDIDDGQVIERFTAGQLIQSEPDASSFPSGGMRTTFEARGYTAWDPQTPIFIFEATNGKTLCVPSVFFSYNGDSLDKKTPLLRSNEALSRAVRGLLTLFGDEPSTVAATLGAEQEYFLVDQSLGVLRPDLVAAGRTLVGAQPPKGQQLEDHYFGSIKPRQLAFMQEVEAELYRLGIPAKTRHNEVSPAQYETAPIFESANVAADHNVLAMEVMRQVARRHDFMLLFHEKPFAELNGSGKHCNWAISADGRNLLDPGTAPHENLEFLVVLSAVLKAVHRRQGIMRAGIASAGQDLRLGANEAPPAIISVFLGEELSAILDAIETGSASAFGNGEARSILLQVRQLPEVARDNTDRNRTSPFAFTGNKFEFRAVPASANTSIPIAYLNAAVAEAIDEMRRRIEARIDGGDALQVAVLGAVKEAIGETKSIRFEGNNYADEWVHEAERRGLLNLAKTPDALRQLVTPDAVEFFEAAGVFSPQEVEARYNVELERYVKDVTIEVDSLLDLARTIVLPAALAHQSDLAVAVERLQSVGVDGDKQKSALTAFAARVGRLLEATAAMEHANHAAEADDLDEHAAAIVRSVLPAQETLRAVCDEVEATVADHLWPLPKYRELLFLS